MIRPPACPICKKPVLAPLESETGFYPFCSARCRQVDLFRWCEGKYAIVEPLTPEKMIEEELAGDLPAE